MDRKSIIKGKRFATFSIGVSTVLTIWSLYMFSLNDSIIFAILFLINGTTIVIALDSIKKYNEIIKLLDLIEILEQARKKHEDSIK